MSAPDSKLQGPKLIINCTRLRDAALQQPSDHCHIKHGQLLEPMLKRTAAMACRDSQVMQRALDMHDTVLRALLARYYGYEVTTEGDSFTMAFHDPVDAVLLLHSPLCTSLYRGGSSLPRVKPRQSFAWDVEHTMIRYWQPLRHPC